METPKVLKFKNGDLVIATMRGDEGDGIVWIDNPIAVVPYPVMREEIVGETFLLKPWIGITEERSFRILTSEIMTTCSLRPNLLEQYTRYISGEEKLPPLMEEDEEIDVDLETIKASFLRNKNLLN